MMDTIYYIECNIRTLKVVIVELNKKFDEDYGEVMFVGSEPEGLHGYIPEEIIYDKPVFLTDTIYSYFSKDIKTVCDKISNMNNLEFHKSIGI